VCNPVARLKKIIEFINPEDPIKIDLIKNVVSKLLIRKTRDISKFRFYNPKLFRKIEQSFTKEIENLKLYKYF